MLMMHNPNGNGRACQSGQEKTENVRMHLKLHGLGRRKCIVGVEFGMKVVINANAAKRE